MRILTNTFDGSRVRHREARALVTTLTILMAGYAPLSPAQSSDPSPSSNSPQLRNQESTLGSAGNANPQAAHSGQPTYSSPKDVVNALLQAVQSDNEQSVRNILGANSELVTSGDAGADKADRELFLQKYQQMHRLGRQSNGSMILYIGAENWPFPVPLVPSHGRWRFDADAGQMEVLFRGIGENEITAINVCHSLVEVQRRLGNHSEASVQPQAGSLVDTLLSGAPGDKAVPFQGYYFRVLSRSPGGFAAIAYPAAYRSSGVMTFVVNQSDVVYEKDLGPAGAPTAQMMSEIRPDSTWKPAQEEPSP